MKLNSFVPKFLVPLCLCFALSGCDQIADFFRQQDETSKHLAAVDEELKNLTHNLTEIAADERLRTAQQSVSSSYNDCVLDHVKSGESGIATQTIEEACLRKSSVPLADMSPFLHSQAAYGQIYGGSYQSFGLYVYFDNASPFTITELTVTLTEKATGKVDTYVVRRFQSFIPSGTIVGMGPDRTMEMRLAPGKDQFMLETTERASDTAEFFSKFTWAFVSAKGFSDAG